MNEQEMYGEAITELELIREIKDALAEFGVVELISEMDDETFIGFQKTMADDEMWKNLVEVLRDAILLIALDEKNDRDKAKALEV